MREDEVPQDDSFYGGHKRACYAVDRDGRYVLATSRGWEPERIATAEALSALSEGLESVRRDVVAGRLSPLAYHMTAAQMTPRLLAKNAGLWTWRVRRHLRPRVFERLDRRTLTRYATCLNLSVESLRKAPAERVDVFGGGEAVVASGGVREP
jgi:hypothetical protein